LTTTAAATDEVLRVENLVRTYGKKRALDGISFTVRRGDVFGFLGPNGSGKTTTIRIVLGLVRASAGRVFLFGEPRRSPALDALSRTGAMVEVPRFYEGLSGRRNLRAFATLSGIPAAAVEPALESVRLLPAADEPVGNWSQGMRQRLGIAQALLGEPDLVILDEPTNGLDPHGVHEMRELITRLNRERQMTFLVSSHQLTEIEQIANRVAILRKGRLLVTGEVEEILAGEQATWRIEVSDAAEAVRALGEDAREAGGRHVRLPTTRAEVPGLVRRLVEAGLDVGEVRAERRSLEDYFLRVTEGEEADLGR
jgi:ABC-2 type transport system ATP-binding protein